MMTQAEPYKRDAPSVTVFLFAYNQSAYVRTACESVLAQDYSPLQIVFSDDCSTDDTFEIMSEIASNYQGIHQIRLNRNPQNLGLIRHVNLSHQLTTTDLLVAAAGDDISEPNRVTEIVKAYRCAANQPTSIHSAVYEMSADGVVGDMARPPINNLKTIQQHALSSALIIGATHAWHRDVFDQFGEITELDAFEDLVLAYRSSLMNGLCYIDQPLVKYRLGVGISESGSREATVTPDLQQKRFLREAKIMIPVLKQRILDSKKNNVKAADVQDIKKLLYQYEVKKELVNQSTSLYILARNSLHQSFFLIFLKIILRKLRKGIP